MDSRTTLENIVNAVADPIFVKDREHRWVLLNDACCKFIGHSRENLIGRSDYDFFPREEADTFWQKDEVVFKTGRENLNEESFTGADGVPHTIITKKTLFVDGDGRQFIVGVIRDVTDLKQAHGALLRQTSELARSEAEREYLEFFAYVAAHDLREPLQRIVGFSDLLKSSPAEKLTEEGRRYLEKIQDGAWRMSALIEDLLNFSRVVKRPELFKALSLSAVVAGSLNDLDFSIRESGAVVKTGPLPSVHGDESQLRQLFQNLFSNAIKFKKEKTPPRITVESRPDGDGFWQIDVRDEGIGFDHEFSEKIFRPFERLHTRDRYPGSGIGLAICRKIVSHHGGKISASSSPGQGTVFSILLPRR